MTVTENPKAINEISFGQRAKDLQIEKQAEEEQKKIERKSPFQRFYQVNKDKSEYLRSCLKENPKALEILLFIFDHMDKYNAVVCSYNVFQEALNISYRTVARSIKYLKDNGFLYIYKTGTSNVYVANNELVWNSWGKNTQYCEFPTNIILSKTEQKENIKVQDKRTTNVQIEKENENKISKESENNA